MTMSPQYESYKVSELLMNPGRGIGMRRSPKKDSKRVAGLLITPGGGFFRYIGKGGVMTDCGGRSFPAVKIISSRMLPRQENRDTAKATNEARPRIRNSDGTT